MLNQSREEFDSTLKQASEMGISYTELLDLDIRKFNCFVDGYMKKRETWLNDSLAIGHRVSAKIAQAVWGSKDFKKEIKPFKITEDKDVNASRNAKVFACLKAKGLI